MAAQWERREQRGEETAREDEIESRRCHLVWRRFGAWVLRLREVTVASIQRMEDAVHPVHDLSGVESKPETVRNIDSMVSNHEEPA